jgi:hypothetical protein
LIDRKAAAAILDTAQGVLRALNGSREAQNKARLAIDTADSDIKNAQTDLTQVYIGSFGLFTRLFTNLASGYCGKGQLSNVVKTCGPDLLLFINNHSSLVNTVYLFITVLSYVCM